MFSRRYFGRRYFAPRYFGVGGAEPLAFLPSPSIVSSRTHRGVLERHRANQGRRLGGFVRAGALTRGFLKRLRT